MTSESQSKMVDAYEALQCLHIAVESTVADDVTAKVTAYVQALVRERDAATKERDFLSTQNTELLKDTAALKAKVEKLETAMKKIASGMAIDGWGESDTLDRTDLITIAGICLTEQNILKERHGSPT